MIQIARSSAPDSRQAGEELAVAFHGQAMDLLVFFCSSRHDLDALADAIASHFAGIPTMGCTTAGEVSPAGYASGEIVAIAFCGGEIAVEVTRIDRLGQFDFDTSRSRTRSLVQALETRTGQIDAGNTFALMLVDGLSQREEQLTRAVQKAIGNIALIGGSAGDDLHFRDTRVYHDGRFHHDAAVVALIRTDLPFSVFKTQHFIRGEEKLVVTEADQPTRTIREINGLPAAEEYARSIGHRVEDLNAASFAAHPVVVRIEGVDFVRSIRTANTDRSLTFYCAIDEGIVLTVAAPTDPVENLRATLRDLEEKVGRPQLVLVCDCILRRLEIEQDGHDEAMAKLFGAFNVLGFNTYGEQFCGVHVNQTLTGIAFGEGRARV